VATPEATPNGEGDREGVSSRGGKFGNHSIGQGTPVVHQTQYLFGVAAGSPDIAGYITVTLIDGATVHWYVRDIEIAPAIPSCAGCRWRPPAGGCAFGEEPRSCTHREVPP
jgi:hypothetical protein